jgi:hypothetical protein
MVQGIGLVGREPFIEIAMHGLSDHFVPVRRPMLVIGEVDLLPVCDGLAERAG